MINRINLILRAKNVTARQFAEEIGIQPSGMSHILGGRNNPSLEFVTKVLRRYPEIDANWLLLGKGEMYASANTMERPVLPEIIKEEPVKEPENPTLFLSEEEPLLSEEEPSYSYDYQEKEELFQTPPTKAAPPVEAVAEERQLERILFIFSDNTFREMLPQ